ncbi:MAG: YARHG domain-containing protein [Spirochaetaceae bacterium]|nr:YARHG domain-containing protein [Spirochaetaceae bacterium]
MKKRLLLTAIIFSISIFCFAQTIERLVKTEDIKLRVKIVNVMPEGIMVDEKNDDIYLINGGSGGSWIYNCENNYVFFDKMVPILNGIERVKLNEYLISYSDTGIFINSIVNGKIANLNNKVQSGISFILKKGNGYIVYYVDESGYPGAVDTTGRIYSSEEAMEYLKEYDPEKYDQSEKRAAEQELYNDFIRNRVLIWGKRYYKPIKGGSLYQYDNQGNRYGCDFFWWGNYKNDWGTFCEVGTESTSNLFCFNINEERFIFDTTLNNYSTILGRNGDYQETRPEYSTSWYVGFGGNIYYYIAGEAYTEVFRIRRTWGDPDFYAMAINGYTDDNYGKYVDEVLPTLSKADLRLLRNTIFAIYGVHFKSADLSAYFDKQVWYTDEGKTSGEVKLPAHRQKLVEMIQKLEKQ